jgi:hypothetical protein
MKPDFVKAFDSKNEAHVLWLRDVGNAMTKVTNNEKVDVIKFVDDNPLPGKPKIKDVMEWAYIHFQLAMKYSNAVLNCDAFVPTTA